jgi:hypothetical protein
MDKNDWINQFQDKLRQAAARHPLQNRVITRDGPLGAKLSASVSPCVWLYDSPFQITVTLVEGGSTFVTDEDVKFAEATEADVAHLLDRIQLKKCRKRGCSNPAFDPVATAAHRDGKCEQCFMKNLNKELEKAQTAERRKLAQIDRLHRARGFTHRVDAWVHADGGDRQLSIWLAHPDEESIHSELQRAGADGAHGYTLHPL